MPKMSTANAGSEAVIQVQTDGSPRTVMDGMLATGQDGVCRPNAKTETK